MVQNVCLCEVVYDISDPPHPKMPCPAKVSTNRFLDVMTVKCQSGEFPIFFDADLISPLCKFSHCSVDLHIQQSGGKFAQRAIVCISVVDPGYS